MTPDPEKMAYPKAVFFIIGQEFCERFSYYGMRVVLSLYLAKSLQFDESMSTVIFHVFVSLCYFLSLPGAMLSDSLLGKFKTIFYLSVVYALGNIVLSLGSLEDLKTLSIPFSMIGLLLIAIGTGGIKPCVSAFGGDQFVLPQQDKQFASFFSIFYFSINAGSLISTTITPIFRKDISCSSDNTCYPLAFGVPAILMVISLIIFLLGKPAYKIKPPEGNIVVKVGSCIAHGLKQKKISHSKRDHWLDYADDKFDFRLIEDIKGLLRVLVLFIPLPIFWALYDQQGSTWTFQANRMDGYTFGYVIKPDQFQVINALLILAFIPLFDKIIYPKLAEYNLLKKPLQRLTVGGLLAGVAFLVSALLELKLETTYPILPKLGESNLNFVNTLPCNISIQLNESSNPEIIFAHQNYIYELIEAKSYQASLEILKNEEYFPCKAFFDGMDPKNLKNALNVNAPDGKANTVLIVLNKMKTLEIIEPMHPDKLEKAEGDSNVRVIFDGLDTNWHNVSINLNPKTGKGHSYTLSIMGNNSDKVSSTEYTVLSVAYDVTLKYLFNEAVNESTELKLGEIEVLGGGNYVISITKNHTNVENAAMHNYPYSLGLYTITKPNSIHMAWLLPQYIIITVGEIMFSITGLEFSYQQAPQSMKAVVQSAWLLTVGFGNVIVVILHTSHFFEKVSNNLFLFTGLMFVDMFIFALMAYAYVPREVITEKKDDPPTPPMNMQEDNDSLAMKHGMQHINNSSMHHNNGFEDEEL